MRKELLCEVLKVLFSLLVLVIAGDLLLNVIDHFKPVPPSAEVIYYKEAGLFAPIFYGAEKTIDAVRPVNRFLDLVFISIEGTLLLILISVGLLLSGKRRWSSMLLAVISALLSFALVVMHVPLAILSLSITILSLVIFFHRSKEDDSATAVGVSEKGWSF